MPFEEYDVTMQGITNALGFEMAEGELRVWGDYEAYKAEVYARVEERGGSPRAVTVVKLAMPSLSPAEFHVCTRGADREFGVPALPPQETRIPPFEQKLAFYAADAKSTGLVPHDILNKLSVDTEKLHLWARGNVVGYEILGENSDANYWINAIEFLGKIADRVRKG